MDGSRPGNGAPGDHYGGKAGRGADGGRPGNGAPGTTVAARQGEA